MAQSGEAVSRQVCAEWKLSASWRDFGWVDSLLNAQSASHTRACYVCIPEGHIRTNTNEISVHPCQNSPRWNTLKKCYNATDMRYWHFMIINPLTTIGWKWGERWGRRFSNEKAVNRNRKSALQEQRNHCKRCMVIFLPSIFLN